MHGAGAWERFCFNVYQRGDLAMEAKRARQSARRELKKLEGGYGGSREEYRDVVLPFWERYNIRPDKRWYDLYCAFDDHYDPRYIPEDLYWQRIYPALNRTDFRHAYTDKCFYGQLFPYLKQPRTILRNSSHSFYNGDGTIISAYQAKELLEQEPRFVIKPSINTGEGVGVYFFDERDPGAPERQHLLNQYYTDYIVQEDMRQHPQLAEFHPDSLNTIRIISLLYQGEVHITSTILRMGVDGSRVDNFSAGGIACPIEVDGRLAPRALSGSSEWLSSHPGGAAFSGRNIPSYPRILAALRQAHKDVPHLRLIGWDFSVDVTGEPVLVEYNGAPGLNQRSCGPMFGNLTRSILDMVLLGQMQPVRETTEAREEII